MATAFLPMGGPECPHKKKKYVWPYYNIMLEIPFFWKELWRFKVKESMHFVGQKYKL